MTSRSKLMKTGVEVLEQRNENSEYNCNVEGIVGNCSLSPQQHARLTNIVGKSVWFCVL